MELSDEIHANLDALYDEAVRTSAEQAFAIAVAAATRRVLAARPRILHVVTAVAAAGPGQQARTPAAAHVPEPAHAAA